jgi:ABC-type amino acid transport substrate-binding protein
MSKRFLVAFVIAAVFAGAAAAQTSPDTLGRIKAAKAINVGYSPDSLPFSFTGPNNTPTGYSIDLCQRVITEIGRTVGLPDLKVNWLAGSVTERLDMVATGRADIECANTSQTLSRLGKVDFSNLIFVDAGGILVKAGSSVNGFTDLGGKRIAVLKGTTTETHLNNALRRGLVNATVVTITDPNDGISRLVSGDVDAYAGDKIKLVGLAVQGAGSTKFAFLTEELSMEPYGLAVPRNDSTFRFTVNKALSQVYSSGEIEEIFSHWFGKLGRPSALLQVMYILNSIPE